MKTVIASGVRIPSESDTEFCMAKRSVGNQSDTAAELCVAVKKANVKCKWE